MSEFAEILLQASRVTSDKSESLFALADIASAVNDGSSTSETTLSTISTITTSTNGNNHSNNINIDSKTIKIEESYLLPDRRSRSYSEPVLSEESWVNSFRFTGPTLPLINEHSSINEDTTILPTMLDKYSTIYNKNGRIGIYTREERNALISKFHEKRRRRIWTKKIRYSCRKNLADRRIRIKGRFVKGSVNQPNSNSINNSNNVIHNNSDKQQKKIIKFIDKSVDNKPTNNLTYNQLESTNSTIDVSQHQRSRSNSNIDVLAAAALTISSKDDSQINLTTNQITDDDSFDEESEEQFLHDFLSGKLTLPNNRKRRHTVV